MRDWPSRQIARGEGDVQSTRQEFAQLQIAMPREKTPQIFSREAPGFVTAQQTLDGIRHFLREAAVADRPRDGGEASDASAHAEVICVLHAAFVADFLAFDADIGDPVLAAAIRATRDVELQVVRKLRQAVLEFSDEPTREALRLGDGQLAEFRARAGHGPAAE